MEELIFVIEEAPEGGFTARALGESIFTEGENLAALKKNILDAVRCHFEDLSRRPKVVRLHMVKDEVLPV